MIKRILISLLLKLLDSSLKLNYKKIDLKAFEKWAYFSGDDAGWRSYLGYEDLKILKEMSFGKDRDHYMMLIGRRLQLLNMGDEFRKAFENRKSAEEKRKSEAEKNNAKS